MAPLRSFIAALFLLAPVYASEELPSFVITDSQRASNHSLLWGPYRPQVYFGVKPRLPKSITTGLMWSRVDGFQYPSKTFRHTAEQADDIKGYDWEELDLRKGGRQVIRDEGNAIDITTEFVKVEGGEHGGHWAVRVKGTPRPNAPKDLKTTMIFYSYLEGAGNLHLLSEEGKDGVKGDVVLKGDTPDLGMFDITMTEGKGNHPKPVHEEVDSDLSKTIYRSYNIPEDKLWLTRNLLFYTLQHKVNELTKKYSQSDMPPPEWVFTVGVGYGPGNMHFMQRVYEGAFEFDILYNDKSAVNRITSETLDAEITKNSADFKAKFAKVFPRQPPFDDPKYDEFAHVMFSNILGGVGYFSGDQVVDRSKDSAYEEKGENFWDEASAALKKNIGSKEGPYELFTTTPSRPFFPRGFYWDEGFHQLLVADWDIDLTLEMVKSWFNRMDEDGWIAREQILGEEARSRVPEEFVTQFPHHANPPTLFLLIDEYLNKLEAYHSGKTVEVQNPTEQQIPVAQEAEDLTNKHIKDAGLALDYLKKLYPSLKKHFEWFHRTQIADLKTYFRQSFANEGYRWRGRTPEHCLTSGLDDYPRAKPPHPGELHVDLLSWMALMSRSIRRIAEKVGETEDANEYIILERMITKNLDQLHWSEEDGMYCDSTIDDFDESVFVCHKGYVSLFPFLIGNNLTPDNEKIGKILEMISNPNELWTEFGIRSLSKSDEYFGTGENYWRGPIWINMNYLIVKALHYYGSKPGPFQKDSRELYTKLRKNIVNNVYEQWKETGYAWEQYDSETGKGQRTKHFSGWTSLVVKIMGMEEETCLLCDME